MSDYLPDDLIAEILKRLPPKTLLMFQCVSRSWYSVINSPMFISRHLEHHHNIGNYIILLRQFHQMNINAINHGNAFLSQFSNPQDQEIYLFHDENASDRVSKIQVFPFSKSPFNIFTIVGCVNGLICLWDGNHVLSHLILWNPAIRKYFRVPNRDDTVPNKWGLDCQKLSFGFGFDARANEYKVLRLAFLFNDPIRIGRVVKKALPFYPRKPCACSADIFSMNTKSWRSVTESVPLEQLSISIYLRGSLHWLTRKERENGLAIVSFSMHSEAFGEMPGPHELSVDADFDREIAIFGDSISLICEYTDLCYSIWVMKEYGVPSSWTLLSLIELKAYPGWKRILGFSWSKQLLLIGNGQWTGYSFGESLEIVEFQFGDSYWAPHAEQYIESLALLEDGDNIPEQRDQERGIPSKGKEKRTHTTYMFNLMSHG